MLEQTVKVPKADANLCYEFAVKSVESNMSEYVARSQENKNKVISDIYIGKLSEIAICRMFYDYNIKCSYPDFKVYKMYRKSYNADLKVQPNMNLHVKSQHIKIAERFGLSWSFQSKDKLISTPENDDYIALCLVDDLIVEIKNIIEAEKVVGKYSDPQKKELITKKVLYFKDI